MDKILEQLRKEAKGVVNTTAHFMNLAETYWQQKNLTAVKACLILLCEKCENYEESIAFNGLTEQWQAYRYLVEGLVSPSVNGNATAPCIPAECSVTIEDIFSFPDDELLSALSEHLNELSGGGKALHGLNKWEQTAYYVDELWVEVNAGGFDSYLYYHGLHFEKAYTALLAISANRVARLLDAIKDKFPQKRIPQTEEALQNTLDDMQERDIDFEVEDDWFYSAGETELLQCLLSYVQENKLHFR